MRHRRIDSLIRLWSWREFVVSAMIAVGIVTLLMTSEQGPWAPNAVRWLALSVVVLWVATARVWQQRNNGTHN